MRSEKQIAVCIAKNWRSRWLKNCSSPLTRQHLVEQMQLVDPHYAMHPIDRQEFAKLPDVLTVYRGFNSALGGNPDGLSWTTSKVVAELFAKGFGTMFNGKQITAKLGGQVLAQAVMKQEIFAYFYVEGEVILRTKNPQKGKK